MRSHNITIVAAWLCLAVAASGQSIPNPSFEVDTYSVWPGYTAGNGGEITGWSVSGAGVGLNPANNLNPFADNGAVPNGSKVAFIQNNGTISTTISGLLSGQGYRITFRANRRSATAGIPYPSWSIDGNPRVPFAVTTPVGGANPYYTVTATFTAAAPTAVLSIMSTSVVDATVLLDDFRIGRLDPDIAVQAPAGIAQENQVIASGNNAYGQSTIPASAMSNVVDVFAGQYFSGVLRNDGTVHVWGDNEFGSLLVPESLQGRIREASSGGNHAVAILDDGSFGGWGWDFYNQVSGGPANARTSVVSVAGGIHHTLVATAGGAVFGWGDNLDNALDIPASAHSGVTAVAASWGHSLAIKNGGVIAWGNNGFAAALVPFEAESGVTRIAAALFGSLALKDDGSCVVWGNVGFPPPVTPTSVTSGVVDIAAGAGSMMALRTNGQVIAWSTTELALPAEFQSRVIAIDAGDYHRMALRAPPPMDFGSRLLGSTSPPQIVSIRNTGAGSPLIITNITIIQSVAADYQLDLNGFDESLTNNQATSVAVRFCPKSYGPIDAVLRIESNDPNEGTFDVQLTGEGLPLTSIQWWRLIYFGAPEDMGPGADTNDFDGDGLDNLAEFAFSQIPTNPASAAVPLPSMVSNRFGYSFGVPSFITGITYGAEWNTNLTGAWLPLTNGAAGTNYDFRILMDGIDRAYLRLKVSQP